MVSSSFDIPNGRFYNQICRYAAAIIMSMAYGHEVGQEGDRYVEISEQATAMLSASVFPGAAIVNAVPIRTCA